MPTRHPTGTKEVVHAVLVVVVSVYKKARDEKYKSRTGRKKVHNPDENVEKKYRKKNDNRGGYRAAVGSGVRTTFASEYTDGNDWWCSEKGGDRHSDWSCKSPGAG